MSKRTRTKKSTRGPSSRSQEPANRGQNSRAWKCYERDVHQVITFAVSRRPIHPRDVIDWDFLATTKVITSLSQGVPSTPETSLTGTSLPLMKVRHEAEVLTMGFWPNIGDGDFIVGGAAVRKIRDPKVRLAHCCIATENPSLRSSPQVLLLFEVYTPLVTYPEEVEESIRILMEVEPLDETQLEDLGLNTWNHDIPLSSREIPSVDEPKPQLLPISHP
ncbi:hypothetical protein Tco_0173198 [Tanacetum coccineum]